MSKFNITNVTVSVEMGYEQEYGRGTKSFASVSSRAGEGVQTVPESVPDAISAGLDMYFTAWQTLLAGRLAQGIVSAETFNNAVPAMERRIKKAKEILCPPPDLMNTL
jgi:hypothetical protein